MPSATTPEGISVSSNNIKANHHSTRTDLRSASCSRRYTSDSINLEQAVKKIKSKSKTPNKKRKLKLSNMFSVLRRDNFLYNSSANNENIATSSNCRNVAGLSHSQLNQRSKRFSLPAFVKPIFSNSLKNHRSPLAQIASSQLINGGKKPVRPGRKPRSRSLRNLISENPVSLKTPQPPSTSNKTSPNLKCLNVKKIHHLPGTPGMPSLPAIIGGADSKSLWECMTKKERTYMRRRDLFSHQVYITSKMRSILLDWIIEVCEAFRLHRETFYVSIDFIDRYLSTVFDIPCGRLQLIGVTSLYLATKMEEIHPPKASEFIRVTDGACTESQLLEQEQQILVVLNHHLTPVTPFSWLSFFLHVYHHHSEKIESELTTVLANHIKQHSTAEQKSPLSTPVNGTGDKAKVVKLPSNGKLPLQNQSNEQHTNGKGDCHTFELPIHHSRLTPVDAANLVGVARILDVAILDVKSLKYPYSMIAATALYLTTKIDPKTITGYSTDELFDCIEWIRPFVHFVCKTFHVRDKNVQQRSAEEIHNFQMQRSGLSILNEISKSKHGSSHNKSSMSFERNVSSSMSTSDPYVTDVLTISNDNTDC